MIGRRGKLPVSDEPKLKGFDDFDLRLGDVMRGERATLGKSLLDVQRELKVKASYIAAIENSDPTAFETQGFVAGYVRSYARYLGLDPEWAYSRFCAESNFSTTDGMTSGAAAKPKKATARNTANRDPLGDPEAIFIPRPKSVISQIEPSALGSVLVLVMLISALGYGGWSVFREVQKVQFIPVDQTPTGISTDIDVLASDGGGQFAVMEDSAAPVPTTEALDRLYRPNPLDVPILAARDAPIGTLSPGGLGAVAPSFEPAPEINDEILADADLSEELSPVQVIEDTPPEIVLFAVRPSWVRVRGSDGTVLFEKILDAGEQYVLPQTEEPPVLRAGNAGSVYFSVNGETFGPAGDGPAVVKNLDLSADSLLASFQPADPSEDADLARFFAVAQAE
jgi:cytoskeletal protein RodZ